MERWTSSGTSFRLAPSPGPFFPMARLCCLSGPVHSLSRGAARLLSGRGSISSGVRLGQQTKGFRAPSRSTAAAAAEAQAAAHGSLNLDGRRTHNKQREHGQDHAGAVRGLRRLAPRAGRDSLLLIPLDNNGPEFSRSVFSPPRRRFAPLLNLPRSPPLDGMSAASRSLLIKLIGLRGVGFSRQAVPKNA